MSYGPYYLSQAEWAWINEIENGSFADEDNNGTKYETNRDTTMYPLPIHIGQPNMVISAELWELIFQKGGSTVATKITRQTRSTPDLTFSGDVMEHTWLHHLCGNVNTTGSNPYTHTYTHGTVQDFPQPSLGLLMRCKNAGTGADLLIYFGGCCITSYTETLDI
jgi:hypothetical protein